MMMPTISRNAPCLCGSGKKYKLCCLPADTAAPPLDRAAIEATREKAVERLLEFGRRPHFKRVAQRAFDAFWSRAFLALTINEQSRWIDHPIAEPSLILHMLLDVPARRGATIVELFLAQHAKHLPRAEVDYLVRLAASHVRLVRVDAVEPELSLSCTDLWLEERIDIRDAVLARDREPDTVLAVRLPVTADGATEHDGGTYTFSAEQGAVLVALLRAERDALREHEPTLSETQFLKRHAPALINEYWIDKVIAQEIDDDDVPLFDYPNEHTHELAEFLHSDDAPTAMTIDCLHGFLCALTCCPVLVPSSLWLPLVWGDEPPMLSDEAMTRMNVRIMLMLSDIAAAFEGDEFAPLLPCEPSLGMANVAEMWCIGFLDAMALAPDAWAPLVADPSANDLLMVIRVLGESDMLEANPDVDGLSTAVLVNRLDTVVPAIHEYWRDARENATAGPDASLRSARTLRCVHTVRRDRERV